MYGWEKAETYFQYIVSLTPNPSSSEILSNVVGIYRYYSHQSDQTYISIMDRVKWFSEINFTMSFDDWLVVWYRVLLEAIEVIPQQFPSKGFAVRPMLFAKCNPDRPIFYCSPNGFASGSSHKVIV